MGHLNMTKLPLFCFPFAGAGASVYRPWVAAEGVAFEAMPVQLPGREQMFNQTPYTNVQIAVAGLLPKMLERIGANRKVALFGHSMGAVLAYEMASTLALNHSVQIEALFVSGSPGPYAVRTQKASVLNDAAFLERVQEFAGYSHPAMSDSAMRSLLLPTLRADVEMHEKYKPSSVLATDLRIVALRGSRDVLVSAEQLWQWQEVTSRPLNFVECDGGHMYFAEDQRELLAALSAHLTPHNSELETGTQYAA